MSTGTALPKAPVPLALRAAGLGLIVGAACWLLGLGSLAAAGLAAGPGVSGSASGLVLPLAIAGLLFTIGIVALETRATRELRLPDLVGDLSIATGAGILVLVVVLGALAPLGPGLMLFHVGAVVFGIAGFDGRRRPRWPSALIGIGAASFLGYLLLGGSLGGDVRAGFAQTAFLGVLLFCAGWAWLGVHLALGRPLDPVPGG